MESPSAKRPIALWLPRIAILIALAIFLFFIGKTGLTWRRWVWDTTVPIRFWNDIDRGYDWGRKSATEGYLNQYEKMQPQQPNDVNWLDYPPLRLGVMTLWGKWSLLHFPKVKIWHQDHSYALTEPVLHFNLAMEILGLVGAFFLTRLWANRRNPVPASDSLRYFFRGWIPGLVTVLLLWFNPAIVISAYGWPTWDLWIIPMFLLAALLASLDWWFSAGIVLGIGAMFKGQQLIAAPMFIIWSLMIGRPIFTLRFCGGVVVAIGLIASPWLVTFIPPDQLAAARAIQHDFGQPYLAPMGTFQIVRVVDKPAIFWLVCVFVAAAGLPWVGWLTLEQKPPETRLSAWRRAMDSPWTWKTIVAAAVIILVGWPWLLHRNRPDALTGLCATASLMAAVLCVRPRGIIISTATATGVALLLCMSVFHGSSAWYDCGFHYGTIHWQRLVQGVADNLPGILGNDFGWPISDIKITVFTIPRHLLWHYPAYAFEISMRAFLLALFWATFFLAAIGIGLQARRRDSRILIGLTAGWLMFFCFPPQIHERYLLYAAAISAVCAGVSAGITLLGILISLATFLMTMQVMLDGSESRGGPREFGKILSRDLPWLFNNDAGLKLSSLAKGMHPDLGYAIILCGLIFLYFSLALRRQPDHGQEPGTK